MKKRIYGLLVAAIAVASCGKEMTEEKPEGLGTVHIEAGAGISGTKTTVDYNAETKERTLKFVMGDKIYVRAEIEGTEKILCGFLNAKDVPAEGSASASFSGDLAIYNYENGAFVPSAYVFSNPSDPLSDCSLYGGSDIVFIPKGGDVDFSVSTYKYGAYAGHHLAATVEELMTSSLPLSGSYDQNTRTFTFSAGYGYGALPIFNCTVTGGLVADASYAVILLAGTDADHLYEAGILGSVKADSDGKASYAFWTDAGKCGDYMKISMKNLAAPYDWKALDLGSRTLESKVYNASRVAVDDESRPVSLAVPSVSGAAFSAVEVGNKYVIDGKGGAIDIAISGTANGAGIVLKNYTSATVTLNTGLAATTEQTFLSFSESGKDAHVVLNGSSTLNSTEGYACIYSSGNLFFSGNGTLKLHATTQYSCAVDAPNYPSGKDSGNQYEFNEVDPLDISSLLAAPGCNVKRKLKRAGYNDYTWDYTVSQPLFVKHSNGTTKYITSDYTAQNGDLLSGTMIEPCKISIADKATVTLAGVSINAGETWKNDAYKYAGITCLGNATLVLADGTENVVTALGSSYPGIHAAYKVGTSTCTLTITGNGKLIASALKDCFGAGIGGADGKDFGNISIEGGDISATGYGRGAGIGAAGGSVICGTIIITDGIKKVTANKNGYAAHCIGLGDGGLCQAVTIDGVDARSLDWDGTGLEHLVLERSNSAKNGSKTYYKTWTLTRKE
jgi:hypothetical protein